MEGRGGYSCCHIGYRDSGISGAWLLEEIDGWGAFGKFYKWCSEKMTDCCSDSAIESSVAYSACGAKHNIVLNETLGKDSLLAQVSKNESSLEIPMIMKWTVLRNAFGLSSNVETKYFEIESDLSKAVAADVYDQIQPLISSTLSSLSETLPDFVTFNTSIVDQMQWERVADVELSDGTSEADCNLFAMVNEFCCDAILPPIIGSQFTESYQLLASDLASFNQRYWALALGLPRWSPIQGLPGAALAQKRLLHNMTRMFIELSNPPVRRVPDDDESESGEETDADVLTPITKLNELFTKHDLAMSTRASITLQLIHEIVSEVVPLVFWTLLHVYASPTLSGTGPEDPKALPVESIRRETKSWAQAIQPPSIHPSFPSPPAIIFDKAFDQITKGSYLHICSCINEARRLYTCSALTYQLKSAITLTEPNVYPTSQDTYELDAGSYIDIGLSQSLINSSPTVFPEPKTFNPTRFTDIATPSSITPAPSPSHAFTSALTMAIVTGIIQLWDISPTPKKTFFEHMQEAREEAQIGAAALTGEQKAARSMQMKEKREKEGRTGKWVIPVAMDGARVKVPRGDVRVRIRRREGLPAGRVGGKGVRIG
jgi:hypothetical protein